jgi:long-chain acyl-CoA synthetase
MRAQILAITSHDILLATRPLNNGSSINTYVLVPVVAGARVVVREKFSRFAFVRAIAQEKVTVLYTVPLVFEILASLPEVQTEDFSSVRLCVSAGAPLARSVSEGFQQRFGIPIRQVYGGSHIHPIFTYSRSGLPGTVGHVSGPFPIAILNEQGKSLGPEQIGEIVFDYANFPRHWKKYLAKNPRRVGSYIYTGDLGKIDEAGNLYIVGRKGAFIKVGGNRVEAAEVESVLRTHPQVKEASVFALRLGQHDEAVGVIVVPAGRVSTDELLEHCAQQLDTYKWPRQIKFRKRLPRNAHGKVIPQLFESEAL